ncbi:hypothetical protein L3Q82_001090 [Scortum barcoo]|uniref:Uncharacterized protein n=1 Tax=Scortum barcoo TaxID=214431 RepID=A0ACB8WA77_9TELE|nr:hypothetical protein L3Q82_001090 [Scortum barcoo]
MCHNNILFLSFQELNNSNNEQRQLEAKAEKEEEETKIDKEQEENKGGDSEKKDKEKMEREEKALIEKEVQKTKTKKRKRKKKRASFLGEQKRTLKLFAKGFHLTKLRLTLSNRRSSDSKTVGGVQATLHCTSPSRLSSSLLGGSCQACWPIQCKPAQVLPRPIEPPSDPVIQGLRDALTKAISEIKSLKLENTELKEKIGLYHEQHVQVINLQEELRKKDELLKREQKKRQMRSKAHLETLHHLTIKQKEHVQHELKLRSKIEALEANIITKDHQLVQVINLQEKLKEKDELLKREQKKREMRSKAHLETLHRLTIMENEHAQHELKWRSKIEALEA